MYVSLFVVDCYITVMSQAFKLNSVAGLYQQKLYQFTNDTLIKIIFKTPASDPWLILHYPGMDFKDITQTHIS